MPSRSARVTQLADALFASGYRFFLPYLALYLTTWLVEAPVSFLLAAFGLLHAVNLALFAVFVHARRTALRRADALFWTALLLFFLLPGAYLEYPADAWEHLRRIYRWEHAATLADNPWATWKFAYLWVCSWIHGIPTPERRPALDLVSAFWQLLVAIQLHVLARRLGFDPRTAKLQVAAFFLLFGQGPKGMRFLALSSTPLAYVAFLAVLVCWIDLLDGRDRRAWRRIPELCLLAAVNHRQELSFIGMGTASLFAVAWLGSLTPAHRRHALLFAGLLALASLLGGAVAWAHLPGMYPEEFHSQISAFGSFRLWQRWYFLDTYGVHGVVSLLLALALARTQPRLALLTWMPTLVLLLPPSAWLITALAPGYIIPTTVHRMLLGFPTSFALVAGVSALLSGGPRRALSAAPPRALAGAGLVVLVLAAPYTYPWNGRLVLQIHRPHPDLELRFLDATVDWFERERDLPARCRILSDGATQYGLLAQLGSPIETIGVSRLRPPRYATRVRTTQELLALVGSHPTCGVLVAIRDAMPPPRPSFVAEVYPSWDARFASPAWLTRDGFRSAAEGLLAHGWRESRVPPGYRLYEPAGMPVH